MPAFDAALLVLSKRKQSLKDYDKIRPPAGLNRTRKGRL